ADDRLEAFYDNPNALRDYFRDIGRMVLAAEGRKANDSHADCYQYFCVPEYGTANGRLHFHAVHFMRTLPTCLFVCRALSSIMVICMLTAIRLLLTFVMSLYLLLRS